MPTTKKRKLIIRYKNILLIILVIWIFSFACQRNNIPQFSKDPSLVRKVVREKCLRLMFECLQSWGEDLCGSPLPHHYRTVQGCLIKSRHRPGLSPRALSTSQQCDFFTENFYPADCDIEQLTHEAVRRVIQPSDSVLEIGSRYGTPPCEVAVRQNNSANLVAVEPDHTVWSAAEVITSKPLPTQCLNMSQYHS